MNPLKRDTLQGRVDLFVPVYSLPGLEWQRTEFMFKRDRRHTGHGMLWRRSICDRRPPSTDDSRTGARFAVGCDQGAWTIPIRERQ